MKIKNLLARLLCMCMMLNAIPAVSEGAIVDASETINETVVESAEETVSETAISDAEETVEADMGDESEDESAGEIAEAEMPEDTDDDSTIEDAETGNENSPVEIEEISEPEESVEVNTVGRYMRVGEGTFCLYADEGEGAEYCGRIGKGVVYAQNETENRTQITVNINGMLKTCWVETDALDEMTDDEIQAYLAECCRAETSADDGALTLVPVMYYAPELVVRLDSTAVGLGETTTLHVDVSGAEDPSALNFSYSKEYLASAAAEGESYAIRLKGIKEVPSTTIMVACGTLTTEVTLKVTAAPTTCTLTAEKTELLVGENVKTEVTLTDGTVSAITYTSGNEAVAKVNADGVITAVSAGETEITAATYKSGVSGGVKVRVYAVPATVTTDKTEYVVMNGGTATVAVTAMNSDGSTCEALPSASGFESSDEKVFTVDANGVITSIGTGTAELTAKVNGVTAKATVKVVDVIVEQKTVSIGVGNTVDLFEAGYMSYDGDVEKIEGVTFKSSAAKYVTVTNAGVVKGIKKGSAVITVNLGAGRTKKLTVKVLAYPKTMKLSATALVMGRGMTRQLKVIFSTNALTQCTYVSSDETVATVDRIGTITAVGAGTANITVTAVSGNFAQTPLTCELTVLPEPQSITFENESYTVCAGDSLSIPAIYEEGTAADITYTSEDKTLMTVTAAGVVKASAAADAVDKSVKLSAVTHTGISCETTVNIESAPTSVAYSDKTAIKMGVGNTMQLPELIVKSGTSVITAASVTYTSSNSKVVKVDDKGSIIALKAGTASITAKTYNGKTDVIKITVYKYPTSMNLNASALELGTGCTYKLTATFNKNAYTKYTFISSNPSVVSVSADGTLTCLAEGSATITCAADSGKLASKSVTVQVLPAPTSIELDCAVYNVAAGDKHTVIATCDAGSYADITFESSDTGVFTVSASGVITAKAGAAGKSATLTATTQNRLVATATVSVSNAPTYVTFSGVTAYTVVVGDTCYLPSLVFGGMSVGESVTVAYKSSKEKVITVNDSAKGLITAKSAGTAVITVTTYNGKKRTLNVTAVKGTVSAVVPNCTEYAYYIREGEALPSLLRLTAYLVVDGKNINGGIAYTSSNTGVATVSENGTVTPVAAGTAVITLKALNGKTATCTIRVWNASRTVTFNNNTVLGVTQTAKLVPVFDDSLSSSVLTYASSDDSVLAVDGDGSLTAKAAGTVVITVKGSYGLETTIAYTVLPGPDNIVLSGSEVTLHIGQTLDLEPRCVSSAEQFYSALTVTSDNTNVVTVNGTAVKAVKTGTATITFTGCNGVSAKCSITVVNSGMRTDAFTVSKAVMLTGKSGSLDSLITRGTSIYRYGYELSTDDASIISVNGTTVQAQASSGSATITLISNGTVLDTITIGIVQTATAVVTVDGKTISSSDTIELKAQGAAGSTAEITVTAKSNDLPFIGDTDITVTIDPFTMASVSGSENSGKYIGTLSAGKTGGSALLVVTVCGSVVSYPINITATVYRALVIGEFINSLYGVLPFGSANINGMASALRSGKYESVTVDSDPNKKKILSDIAAMAKAAGDNDVTFIYIVAHGYYDTAAAPDTYAFGIPVGSSKASQVYMTSEELLNAVATIPGKVILALDTCKSGYFVDYAGSRIGSNGNLAVITNQKHAEGAWYRDDSLTVEFFTAALMYAMGNTQYSSSFTTLPGIADADGNGELTLGEVFDFTLDRTPKMVLEKIPKFRNGYFYIGSATGAALLAKYSDYTKYNREGNCYVPSSMRDLVIQ